MQFITANLPLILSLSEPLFYLFLTVVFYFAVKKFNLNKEVTDAFKSAVMETYREVVKPWKVESKDGKLTDVQKQRARDIAKGKIMNLLKGKALVFFKAMWSSKKDMLIESIVTKFSQFRNKDKK